MFICAGMMYISAAMLKYVLECCLYELKMGYMLLKC